MYADVCLGRSTWPGTHRECRALRMSFSRRPKRARTRKAYCQAEVKSAAFSAVTSVVPVSMDFT
ncbi:hypothetical protein GCM10027448_33150 [Nocardioides dilutus]